MSKILGDKKIIEAARGAAPGDKTMYINWDAIAELPDEYEAVVTEIKFDPKKLDESFSDVGNGTWMPTPAMHYKIAEARGIEGCPDSVLEPIYEDVNISEMLMEDIPKMINMITGYRCKKQSTVIEEDGTTRRSSPCTIDYNVWNRCAEAWSKEESFSEGYSKPMSYNGKTIFPKYDTKYKRKAHFYSELKFAMQKAETKAHEKTIRELAGLMTGYKTADLSKGSLVFAKIRRSRDVLRMETAARLQAISRGVDNQGSAALLFGPSAAPEKIVDPVVENNMDPVVEDVPQESNKDLLIRILETYYKDGLVPENEETKKKILSVIDWLSVADNPESQKDNWSKAVGWLKKIEADDSFPDAFRINHHFY